MSDLQELRVRSSLYFVGMDVFISHISALICLRRFSAQGAFPPRVKQAELPAQHEQGETSSQLADFIRLEQTRMDVLVASAPGRRNDADTHCHVWSAPVPENSFLKAAPSVYVSSPEFCFLQMAGSLSLPKLIQLGFELCGCYVIDARTRRGFTRTKRPMTTPVHLAKYLQATTKCYGHAKAMRALRWIVENSWSPMETDITILLTLPTRMGGYQMPLPKLNHRIDLPSELQQRAGVAGYCLDMVWPNLTSLEFNGVEDHLSPISAGRDRTREMILRRMGIQLIVVTQYQVLRADEFDTTVKSLCMLLHRKYRIPTKAQMAKKHALRQELFSRFGADALIA